MRLSLVMILSVVSLLLVSCGGTGSGNPKARIAEIEQLIPLFESYRLAAFRNEDWCKALEYGRGRFATSSGEACTSIMSGHRRPFDKTARRDHATINQAIRKSCDALRTVTAVRLSKEGTIEYGVFDCREGKRGRVYVYSTSPLGDEPAFEGTALEAVTPNWWIGR